MYQGACMNIPSVSLNKCMNKPETSGNNSVSFKGIFIDKLVNLGNSKDRAYPPRLLKKDALLLNVIAQQYPNQDCFIRRGYADRPRLEYREKPPEVTFFEADFAKRYKISIDAVDKDYPCEPLIIYPDSPLNFIIGVPSYISTNPSLPYTVKAGYELHKKLIEKKMQIMDVIGKNDSVDFGGESVMQKAHKAIEEVEVAVTRYLVESAYAALADRASARQIYASDFPIIQDVLDNNRRLDLITSVAHQASIKPQPPEEMDICDFAMKYYPKTSENIDRIKEITEYMHENGMTLEDSEDLR